MQVWTLRAPQHSTVEAERTVICKIADCEVLHCSWLKQVCVPPSDVLLQLRNGYFRRRNDQRPGPGTNAAVLQA